VAGKRVANDEWLVARGCRSRRVRVKRDTTGVLLLVSRNQSHIGAREIAVILTEEK
jgi:hypothetical protein